MPNIESCRINSHYGEFEFYCFNYGDHEDENVLVLRRPFSVDDTPVVRIQSACFTAEIFRSKDCDCHEQLEKSLEIIHGNGGLFIYLLQDGRGAGIYKKIQGLKLGEELGLDTADAYDKLKIDRDPRSYDRVLDVLKYFRIEKLNLLTNNPRKINGLTENGIIVTRMPLEIEPTDFSEAYLKTKKNKLGHLFNKYF